MGVNDPALMLEVSRIIKLHDDKFVPEKHITTKSSSKGNYVSLNAIVNATSKAQLDDIYRALNSHKLVKITL